MTNKWKNRKVKIPKFQPVRFYPILIPVKRRKTPRDVDRSITTEPTKFELITWCEKTLKAGGSKSLIYNTRTSNFGGVSNVRTFTRVPDWRVKIAKGQDASAAYSRSIYKLFPVRYSAQTSDVSATSVAYGTQTGLSLIAVPVWAPLVDRALTQIKHKLNGYIGNAQVLPPLAESREIHRLVRQINGLGLETVKSLLAIKKTKGKSALKLFGDVWLGFGFGVNPMLKDIEKAANAILDYTTRQDSHVVIKGTASSDFHSGQKGNPVGSNMAYGANITVDSSAHHVAGVQIVAGIDLQLRTAASYSVTDHLGLEISEIPSALWELTPYSWAVDYFVTVSPWIDDMFFTLPGVTKYITQSKKYQVTTDWVARPIIQPGFTCSMNASPGLLQHVSFTRELLSSLPSRSIRVKSTDEIAKYGVTKLLNLASILAGRSSPRL
jgi:hypothetical protein